MRFRLWVFLSLFFYSWFSYGAALYDAGYQLPASTTKKVYVPQGSGTPVWFSVANASANNYFIPTATAAEWTAFQSNLPSNVTLTAIYPKSCLDILNYSVSAIDGNYTIYPTSNSTPITAYCDMTSDSGGWTRLNASLATSTSSFGANDIISGTNIGQACASYVPNVTISSVLVPSYTNLRMNFTRSTTVMQCPVIAGLTSITSFYDSAGTWVAATTCGWSTPWASGTINNISTTGLASTWKIMGSMPNTGFNFYSHCSGASDNGAYTLQFWVK